jgi:tRNA pseudouridine38-40 synthase
MEDGITYRLLLEYDGTDFWGWQIQEKGRTVQAELESALEQLMGESVKTVAAGRTDSGVHALGQVVTFRCQKSRPPDIVHKALNGLLPFDIRIRAAAVVHASFHARFSAKWRRYRYRFIYRPSALDRHRAWFPPFTVDWELAIQESKDLLGVHDFTAFSKMDKDNDNPRCNIQAIAWQRDNRGISFEVQSDRFLRHMVRCMVGTMVDVGKGRFVPGTVAKLLTSLNRTECGVTAPARGLYLVEVGY